MRMTCNVIKDLLPSYADDICSTDTKLIVEEHIQTCDQCRKTLEAMGKSVDFLDLEAIDEIKAKMPFQKINKMNRKKVALAVFLTMIVTAICMMIVINVGSINKVFFPNHIAVVSSNTDNLSWCTIYFDENNYLFYDSVFYKKEVINDANSSKDVTIRVLDEDGNVIVDDLCLKIGNRYKLSGLKMNTIYTVEALVDNEGYYMLRFY